MAATVDFQGMDTLQGVLAGAPANASAALMEAIDATMDYVFSLSQQQVPVRFGTLKGSGHIIRDMDSNEVSIGYGGAAAGYALWVHENLTAHHRRGQKAKYLEDPMKEAVSEFMNTVGDDRLSAAILGIYPKSPAKGQQTEMISEVGKAGSRKAVAHAPAMTGSQIHAALSRIAAGDRRMQRARSK